MSKFDSSAAFAAHGYTFSGFFDAVRSGFLTAYEQKSAEGFDPAGPLQEGSKERVLAVFKVLEEQYGNVDLKPLGPISVVSAVGLFQAINDVVQGLEAYANAKPEDFEKVRNMIAADETAKALASGPYSGIAN